MRLLITAWLVVCVASACSFNGASTASAARTSPSGSPLASATGLLDAQVPMPPDFPADVPIFTGARLTAGAAFTSTGQIAWGMEWETLASVGSVQAFYAKQLNQGDWTITVNNSNADAFSAAFSRKTNAHFGGTLAGNANGGLTKILMSLVSPR
jgi:hypothetical protein